MRHLLGSLLVVCLQNHWQASVCNVPVPSLFTPTAVAARRVCCVTDWTSSGCWVMGWGLHL